MTQGAPETGREVGLMYSFSSESDEGFSPLDATDAGSDLSRCGHHKACFSNMGLKTGPK